MSTAEGREDDARREPVIEATRRMYDAAATESAAYVCVKRHRPLSVRRAPYYQGPLWSPHAPGSCDMAQQIENALWLAKDPPGLGMTNPPRVYCDQMDAFITRVSERTGVDFSEGRRCT